MSEPSNLSRTDIGVFELSVHICMVHSHLWSDRGFSPLLPMVYLSWVIFYVSCCGCLVFKIANISSEAKSFDSQNIFITINSRYTACGYTYACMYVRAHMCM